MTADRMMVVAGNYTGMRGNGSFRITSENSLYMIRGRDSFIYKMLVSGDDIDSRGG